MQDNLDDRLNSPALSGLFICVVLLFTDNPMPVTIGATHYRALPAFPKLSQAVTIVCAVCSPRDIQCSWDLVC
eukprot:4321072-Pleurochrysis_carterae.AAC.3